MVLLPIDSIQVHQEKINEIDKLMKSIYRLIVYSRYHLDDDLLDIYVSGIHELQDLLGIKNAQMEAQNEEEAKEYLLHLKVSLDFVLKEVVLHHNFEKEKNQ